MAVKSKPLELKRLPMPGLRRLLTYRRDWLRGDVLAGVTVAAYLIPQCMALWRTGGGGTRGGAVGDFAAAADLCGAGIVAPTFRRAALLQG